MLISEHISNYNNAKKPEPAAYSTSMYRTVFHQVHRVIEKIASFNARPDFVKVKGERERERKCVCTLQRGERERTYQKDCRKQSCSYFDHISSIKRDLKEMNVQQR